MSYPSLSKRPPKRLRKGTRSCLQCRERKIRCVSMSDEQDCEGCTLRGSECHDQEHRLPKAVVAQKKRQRHREMVEVGDLVSQILLKLGPISGGTARTRSEIAVIEALKKFHTELPLAEEIAPDLPIRTSVEVTSPPSVGDCLSAHRERLEEVPLVALLTKSFHHGHDASLAEAGEWQPPGNSQVAEILRAILPKGSDLTLILQNGQRGWSIWQKAFPEIQGTAMDGLGPSQIQDLQSFIHLVLSTDEVATIAKVLLCVALCIQQLPPNIDLVKAHLPASAEALEAQFLAPIENFFSTHNRCACTLEGLQCILIQTRIYINAGKVHKAWFLFRRGIDIAHLLGLHQQTMNTTSGISRYKYSLWSQIWQGERYLSLQLGLPYATSDKHIVLDALQAEGQGGSNVETVQIQLGVVAGLLIDRDQGSNRTSLTATMRIEEELERCQKLLPNDCWHPVSDPQHHQRNLSDILAAKFTVFNLRKLLFLPFILQDDSKHDFARAAALEASREMIKIYQIMRNARNPLFGVCNMADLQVFTAAMVLVIDLISSRQQELDNSHSDWNIIYVLMQDLRRVSTQIPRSAATQAARILDDFYKLRFDPPAQNKQPYQATIPYFGKFTFNLVKDVATRNSTAIVSSDAETFCDSSTARTGFDPLDFQGFTFESYSSLLEDDLTKFWTSNIDSNLCNDWGTLFGGEGLD